jgi:UDP-2,3-diacylglucosamine pyrophosphatase LpxH
MDTMKKVFRNLSIIEGTYTMMLAGKKVILMHGDEFDSSGSLLNFCFRCLAPFQWMFTKGGMSFSYRLRDWYYKQKHGSDFYHKITIGTEKNTIKKYDATTDVIIMGHTHMAKVVVTPGYIYANCGTALDHTSAVEFNGKDYILVRY